MKLINRPRRKIDNVCTVMLCYLSANLMFGFGGWWRGMENMLQLRILLGSALMFVYCFIYYILLFIREYHSYYEEDRNKYPISTMLKISGNEVRYISNRIDGIAKDF